MPQRPQTTVLKLLDVARDLRLGEALVPPEIVRTVHSARAALTDDGRIADEALGSLPWQVRDAHVAGPVALGHVPGVAWRFPQPVRAVMASPFAETAPATGPLTIVLTVNGADTDNVSIPKGATQPLTYPQMSVPIPAGAIVRWRIQSTGGAANVTLSLFYVPDSGGA